jgi:threonine dehydrogenase-like Zn-dependent dehydrogenase
VKRLTKPAGKHNVVVEDAPKPVPGTNEVRIRAVTSLISRGSEIGGRYSREEEIDPERMGYSLAGIIDATGDGVSDLKSGDRVVSLAPHAQYAVRPSPSTDPDEFPWVVKLPETVTLDDAPYYPLVAAAVSWWEIEEAIQSDVVVILGQGLVGSLMLQVAKAAGHETVIAIDALSGRCETASLLGADFVVNARDEDPVAAVTKITNGAGADIVAYAVGGPAGPRAFEQGVEMLASGGLIHLIGLYEDAPLPLNSGMIQGKRLIGGYYNQSVDARISARALYLLAVRAIDTSHMTTHRFHHTEAAQAYRLLNDNPEHALGVLLDW